MTISQGKILLDRVSNSQRSRGKIIVLLIAGHGNLTQLQEPQFMEQAPWPSTSKARLVPIKGKKLTGKAMLLLQNEESILTQQYSTVGDESIVGLLGTDTAA